MKLYTIAGVSFHGELFLLVSKWESWQQLSQCNWHLAMFAEPAIYPMEGKLVWAFSSLLSLVPWHAPGSALTLRSHYFSVQVCPLECFKGKTCLLQLQKDLFLRHTRQSFTNQCNPGCLQGCTGDFISQQQEPRFVILQHSNGRPQGSAFPVFEIPAVCSLAIGPWELVWLGEWPLGAQEIFCSRPGASSPAGLLRPILVSCTCSYIWTLTRVFLTLPTSLLFFPWFPFPSFFFFLRQGLSLCSPG
jgi:hypothetical protein